jgi:hypothetical protein
MNNKVFSADHKGPAGQKNGVRKIRPAFLKIFLTLMFLTFIGLFSCSGFSAPAPVEPAGFSGLFNFFQVFSPTPGRCLRGLGSAAAVFNTF